MRRSPIVGDRELPRILERGLGGWRRLLLGVHRSGEVPPSGLSDSFRDFLRAEVPGPAIRRRHRDGRRSRSSSSQSNRDVLFGDTPVVFFASRPSTQRLANSTGVIAPLNLSDYARTGHRAAAGPRAGVRRQRRRRSERRVRTHRRGRSCSRSNPDSRSRTCQAFRPATSRRGCASLPAHSMVYYLVVDRDGAGENFHPLEYLDRVTAVANAPIYCWVDSAMDHGIVGGSLKRPGRPKRRRSPGWPCGFFTANPPTASRS